jgi:hypothetical protein
MTESVHEDSAGESLLQEQLGRQIAELEERYQIGSDRYCGLTPADISRAEIACHSDPRRPGEPVGYWPVGSEETRTEWLRAEYGPAADIERLRVIVQFFEHRLSQTLQVDWQLPDVEFDRAVAAGLARHYPELTNDARRVIAGNFRYSHAR